MPESSRWGFCWLFHMGTWCPFLCLSWSERNNHGWRLRFCKVLNLAHSLLSRCVCVFFPLVEQRVSLASVINTCCPRLTQIQSGVKQYLLLIKGFSKLIQPWRRMCEGQIQTTVRCLPVFSKLSQRTALCRVGLCGSWCSDVIPDTSATHSLN